MTYTTTLIIPFRFACKMGEIAAIDSQIQEKGIWQRVNYSDQNACRPIAELYNESGNAAMYSAGKETVNRLFGSREFRVTSGQEQYDYSYGRLTLFVFATGVGFLCTELSVREAAALRRLRSVVAKGVKHYKKTGKDTYEELPMMELIGTLLNFAENQPFFTSPNPASYAQANLLIYAYNDSQMTNDAVIDDIFAGAGESAAKRLNPFAGVAWGISARCVALVSNADCRIASTQLQSNAALHYLPLIVLALHQKAAAFRYAEDIRTQSGQSDRLREEITAFQNTFLPENVSDAPVKQQIYNEVKRLNPAETAPLTAFLAEKNKGSSAKDKVIGAVELLIAVAGIFSILSDGIDVIQKIVPESMAAVCRYGLYGLCAVLAAVGCYGVYLLVRPSKKS